MTNTVRGVIRGRTIELADDPEFDAILATLQQERHFDRPGVLAGWAISPACSGGRGGS